MTSPNIRLSLQRGSHFGTVPKEPRLPLVEYYQLRLRYKREDNELKTAYLLRFLYRHLSSSKVRLKEEC